MESRKRDRSSSPTTAGVSSTKSLKERSSLSQGAQGEQKVLDLLRDPKTRNVALNLLLRTSCSHETNYALSSDAILKVLAKMIIHDILDWEGQPLQQKSIDNQKENPAFRSKQAWTLPPTSVMVSWMEHCKLKLGSRRGLIGEDKFRTMEAILGIIRNFSFVGANLRLIAYEPELIAILVGCLFEGSDTAHSSSTDDNTTTTCSSAASSGNNRTLAMSAIHTFVHIAPYLDFSGQKLLSDKLFYAPYLSRDGPIVPNNSTFGQAVGGGWGFGGMWLAKRLDIKEDTVADVRTNFLLSLTSDYLVTVWSLFSALTHLLTDPRSPRPIIMMAVDLLQELINHARVGVVGAVDDDDDDDDRIPTIRAILVNMPDSVIDRLTDLLYVPRLGPDSLDYIDPVHNIVTRVTTLKLLMGYDSTVDTDIRDRVLDVLVPLLELDSPRMAARLGTQGGDRVRTRLFDALVPILTTSVGRNEASMLAAQLFRELAKAKENRIGLDYVQRRLMGLASRDPRISHLVWNHLYPAVEEG